jgi:L-aspartate semialdehyde sulfurtransferase ferredoxin
MNTVKKVRFNYPLDKVELPIISRLVSEFNVEPNLVLADVDAKSGGWIVVELRGDMEQLDRAITWVRSQGVDVTDVE